MNMATNELETINERPTGEDKNKKYKIRTAVDLDDLFYILGNVCPILGERKNGSLKLYQPNELIDIIQDVRDGRIPLDSVPPEYGIRDKVKELLEK